MTHRNGHQQGNRFNANDDTRRRRSGWQEQDDNQRHRGQQLQASQWNASADAGYDYGPGERGSPQDYRGPERQRPLWRQPDMGQVSGRYPDDFSTSPYRGARGAAGSADYEQGSGRWQRGSDDAIDRSRFDGGQYGQYFGNQYADNSYRNSYDGDQRYYGTGYRGFDDSQRYYDGGYRSSFDDDRRFSYSQGTGYGYGFGTPNDSMRSDAERGASGGYAQGGYAERYGRPGENLRAQADSGADYRGKGPKGYTRSDERIKEDISERLTDDPFVNASDVSVESRNGVVTLEGSVNDRRIKHRIEDIVERCNGVKDIENRLTIKRAAAQSHDEGRRDDNDADNASSNQAKKRH